MNVDTDEIIQVDKKGFRRRVPAEALWLVVSMVYVKIRRFSKRIASHRRRPPDSDRSADSSGGRRVTSRETE